MSSDTALGTPDAHVATPHEHKAHICRKTNTHKQFTLYVRLLNTSPDFQSFAHLTTSIFFVHNNTSQMKVLTPCRLSMVEALEANVTWLD